MSGAGMRVSYKLFLLIMAASVWWAAHHHVLHSLLAARAASRGNSFLRLLYNLRNLAACSRGYDVIGFAKAGAASSIGLEIAPTAVRLSTDPSFPRVTLSLWLYHLHVCLQHPSGTRVTSRTRTSAGRQGK